MDQTCQVQREEEIFTSHTDGLTGKRRSRRPKKWPQNSRSQLEAAMASTSAGTGLWHWRKHRQPHPPIKIRWHLYFARRISPGAIRASRPYSLFKQQKQQQHVRTSKRCQRRHRPQDSAIMQNQARKIISGRSLIRIKILVLLRKAHWMNSAPNQAKARAKAWAW